MHDITTVNTISNSVAPGASCREVDMSSSPKGKSNGNPHSTTTVMDKKESTLPNGFDQLDMDVQARIREKQKAKKDAKKTNKKRKATLTQNRESNIATGTGSTTMASITMSSSTSTSTNTNTIIDLATNIKPASVRTIITSDEYFGAASGGLFRDPQIQANPESIKLLFQVLQSGTEFGNLLCTCNYFQFTGSKEQIWDPVFNARLAWEGFFTITTSRRGNVEPLPELQPFYGVLFWEQFATSKPTKRVLHRLRKSNEAENYELAHMVDPDRTWKLLDAYHRRRNGSNWLTKQYFEMMRAASINPNVNFELNVVELYASEDVGGRHNSNSNSTSVLNANSNSIPESGPSSDTECALQSNSVELGFKSRLPLAGEIGFTIGGVYTSLSGWTSERNADGDGITQLVLLGRWLQTKGYAFWSLGHCYSPELDYKRTLGQRVYERNDFLALLHRHRGSFNLDTTHPQTLPPTHVTADTNTGNSSSSPSSASTSSSSVNNVSHLKVGEVVSARTLV